MSLRRALSGTDTYPKMVFHRSSTALTACSTAGRGSKSPAMECQNFGVLALNVSRNRTQVPLRHISRQIHTPVFGALPHAEEVDVIAARVSHCAIPTSIRMTDRLAESSSAKKRCHLLHETLRCVPFSRCNPRSPVQM